MGAFAWRCGAALLALGVLAAPGISTPAQAQKSLLGLKEPGPDAPLNLNADQLTYSRDGRIATATGNVEIQYGAYTVFADTVSYNRDNGTLTASGNVRLVEPNGNVIQAEHIELSDKFREGFVRQLTLLMTNDARLHARSAERREGNITILNDATYTLCKTCADNPTRPLVWQIKARKVIHDKKERTISYEDAALEIFGVPVFYIPAFSHPDPTVRRKSGILTPTFSASSEFGVGVEVPYFFNLAPNYDLTLSPLITSKQGPLFKAKWRQRTSGGQYSITPTGIYQLKKRQPPGDTRARGSIATQGNFNLSPNWTYGWDAIVASDDTYLRRYKINDDTDLTSQVYLTGLAGENYFDMRSYYFRAQLAGEDNDRVPYVLPSIEHYYRFSQPVLGGRLGLDSQFLNLQRDSGTDSTRIVSELNWKRSMIAGTGQVITPFARLRGDVFYVNNVVDPTVAGGKRDKETVARVLPTAGVDMRWPLVNRGALGQQIFEPVVQLIARTNETGTGKIANEDSRSFEFDTINLFSIDKFSGVDRWEGGVRANVGFNYTLNFLSGMTARFAFGQSYQLAGRNSFGSGTGLAGGNSDFVGSAYFLLNEYFSASARFRLDDESLAIRRNELGARAKYGKLTAVLSYSDIDSNTAFGLLGHEEEITTNAAFQVTERWRVYAGIRYDIERSHLTEDVVGVGYEDECFSFQLQYSERFTEDRDIDPDRSLMLRFELKSIGGAGISTGIN